MIELAEKVIAGEKADVILLSITFVPETEIRGLNRKHLGKNVPTDVIAFSLGALAPLRSLATGLIGDIYICPEVARRQAAEHNIRVYEELKRLIVHGVLHVLGYDHPAGDARTRSAMWRRQERYLGAHAK